MSLAFVRRGGYAAGTGSVTPVLMNGASSDQGNLLVATLASAGTSFTAPSGWIKGPSIGSSGAIKLVGADVALGTWGAMNAAIGPAATHRIFYSGNLPATFNADGTPDNVTIIVSYKTRNTNVASYVNSIPSNRNVVMIYHHEPENDYSSGATFVSEFNSQSTLIRAQGRSNVKVAMCALGYKYGAGATAEAQAGHFIPPASYVDMYTIDVYHSWWCWASQGLSNFSDWLRWLDVVADKGKPLGITEYAVNTYDWPTISDRYQQIQKDWNYLKTAFGPGGSVSSSPLQHLCYWWWDMGSTFEFKFTDTSTVNLWKQIATASSAYSAIYYYPNNPGGISSAKFTTTTGVEARGGIAEFSSSPGTSQTIDTQGTTSMGHGTSCPVSATSANASGDLGIASFAHSFASVDNSSSWNIASGWTNLSAIGANILSYNGIYKTGVPSGTLSVTGSCTSAANDIGWAAAVATFKELGTSIDILASPDSVLGSATIPTPLITSSGLVRLYPSPVIGAANIFTPRVLAGQLVEEPDVLPRPDIVIEGAFTSGDDGEIWSNLSDYVEGQDTITISHRRQQIFDEVASGTMAVTFDNSDDTFTNDAGSSPFYGLVNIDVPIRFRCRWPRVPYDTANMLSDVQSLATSTDGFIAEQGSIDVDTAEAPSYGNLFSDPSFEVSVAGWTLDTGYVIQASDYPRSPGTYCLSTSTSGEPYVLHSPEVAVMPGQIYEAGAWVRQALASATVVPGIRWLNQRGKEISVSLGSSVVTSATYQDATVTATAPDTAKTAELILDYDGSAIGRVDDAYFTSTLGSILWSTGVLDATSTRVLVGSTPSCSPDTEQPIYVKPGTLYSACVRAKASSAGSSSLGTPYIAGTAAVETGSTSVNVPLTQHNIASGDSVSVIVTNNSNNVTNVTDSKGNSYSLQQYQLASSIRLYHYQALNSIAMTGSDSVTVTFAYSPGTQHVIVVGCSGVLTASAVDPASTSAVGNSGSPAVTSGQLAQTGELCIATLTNTSTGGVPASWGGGFSQLGTTLHVDTTQYTSVATKVATSTSPITASASITSTSWAMSLIMLKPSTANTSLSVSGRMLWYDIKGSLIGETTGSTVSLTTSYKNVDVSDISPWNAHSLRIGVANESTVAPISRQINFSAATNRISSNVWKQYVRIPSDAKVGDVALAFARINDKTQNIDPPDGWTYQDSWTDVKGKTQFATKVLTVSDIGKKFYWTIRSFMPVKFGVFVDCYSGVNQIGPIHQRAESTEASYVLSHVTPNVTTTIPNCLIVSAVFDISSTSTSWGAPGSEQVRTWGYGLSGGNAPTGVISDYGSQQAAGTYGTKTFTSNKSSRYATKHTIALTPVSDVGPGNVDVYLAQWQLNEGSLASWQQGGTWVNAFTGLVDSWEKSYRGDVVVSELTATDRQKQLSVTNVEAAIYQQILDFDPVAYYKLDESANKKDNGVDQEAANSSALHQPPLSPLQFGTRGSLDWGSGIGPGKDASAALVITKYDASNGLGLCGTLDNPIKNASDVTCILWWKSTDADTSTNLVPFQLSDASNGQNPKARVTFQVDPDAPYCRAIASINTDATSCEVTASKAANYGDGNTHMLAVVASLQGGQLITTLYIDGVQQAQSSSATNISEFPIMSVVAVGNNYRNAHLCKGTYSHLAIYDQALDAGTISDIYTAGNTAFAGDTVDQRILRICDWKDQDKLEVDPSVIVCSRHMPEQQTLLSALQQAARTDGGTVYINGSGEISFKSRAVKELEAEPLLIISASQVGPTMRQIIDDQLLVNRAVINRLGAGVSHILEDSLSQSHHGVYEKPVDTILAYASDGRDNAAYLVAFYNEPTERCDAVETEGLLLQNWPAVLGTDMWKILRITDLPRGTLDLYIEGWQFDINPDSWRVSYDTSAVIPIAILNHPTRGVVGRAVVGW